MWKEVAIALCWVCFVFLSLSLLGKHKYQTERQTAVFNTEANRAVEEKPEKL